MKVALINSYYYPDEVGGAEVIVREQAHALSSRGYDVFVVCLGRNESIIEEDLSGIRVYRVPFSNRYWPEDWASHSAADHVLWHLKDRYNRDVAGYVKDIIVSERPQLAICHNLSGLSVSVWDVLSKAGVKILQYVHDQYLACLKSTCFNGLDYCEKPCMKCSLAKRNARRMSSSIDGAVPVSDYVGRRLISLGYFHNVPVKVIHNARSISSFKPRIGGDSGFTIGYIGAVSRIKGVHVLIKAFVESGLDAKLLIAGRCVDGKYECELKSLCGDSGKVEFLGRVDSRDFYPRIDCLVVPSLWPDTFPTVAFESCAAGVPVVASNIGGLPEIVKEGVNGILFNPGDTAQLAGILGRLAGDPSILEHLSVQCRDSVAEMTDTERMYDSLIDFISEIC